MNLTSGLEEHPHAFLWAVGTMSSLMLGITAICWVRLIRARRSQLFLRSARPSRDEALSRAGSWRAGPVAAAGPGEGQGQSQARGGGATGEKGGTEGDVHEVVEEATGQRRRGDKGTSTTLKDKAREAVRGGDERDALHAKDGSTL